MYCSAPSCCPPLGGPESSSHRGGGFTKVSIMSPSSLSRASLNLLETNPNSQGHFWEKSLPQMSIVSPWAPKLHQNGARNGTESHQREVPEPPRERHRNRRRKASLTDPKRPPKGTPKWSRIRPKWDSGPKNAQKKGGFLSGVPPLSPKVTKKHQKHSHNL